MVKVRLLLITLVALVVGSLFFGYYKVEPNTTGLMGGARDLSLMISKGAFSCEARAEEGREAYDSGELTDESHAQAREWFEMALGCQSPVALDYLGYMYLWGDGVPQNINKGTRYLNQAIEAGHAEAARTLAFELYTGQVLAWDYDQARANFEICAAAEISQCKGYLAELVGPLSDSPDYASAADYARQAANEGSPRGQGVLSWLYLWGHGVEKDEKKALEWAETASSDEDFYAIKTLGTMYRNGYGVPIDGAKAKAFFEVNARNGSADAYLSIGEMYEVGSAGFSQSLETAGEYYRKAADLGDIDAQRIVGLMYAFGSGVDHDYSQAYGWLKQAADEGDALSMLYVGRLHLNGVVPDSHAPDVNRARYFIQKAADMDQPEAITDLGWMYYRGIGVRQDHRKAHQYAKRGAESGYAGAEALLGYLLILGHGTDKNVGQGIGWLEKSASGGSATGKGLLGVAYLSGTDVPRDEVLARAYLEEALEEGFVDAAVYLGLMYQRGIQYEADLAYAYAYFDFAARRGSQEGDRLRSQLTKTISPRDAQRARPIVKALVDRVPVLME